MVGVGCLGIVTRDRVVGQASQQVQVGGGGGVLEAPDPQVAAGDAGEHGARQRRFAVHRESGADYCQRPRRRDTQSVHRLADDVLAQHRSHRGEAVTAAGERRGAGTLEVDVANAPVGADELAQQQRAPVAQPRHVAAELMPGVGLRYRSGAAGNQVAHQEAQPVCTAQPGRVEAKLGGQRLVERQQSQVGKSFGLPADSHLRQVAQEAVLQGNGRIRSDAHVTQTTETLP